MLIHIRGWSLTPVSSMNVCTQNPVWVRRHARLSMGKAKGYSLNARTNVRRGSGMLMPLRHTIPQDAPMLFRVTCTVLPERHASIPV